MDWIFDNFQILALVGLALASWLKARADAKAAEREARELMELPGDVGGPEEPQARPFWETPVPPPLPVVPPPLPAHAEVEREMQRQMELQERLQRLRESRNVRSGGAAATRDRLIRPEAAAVAAPTGLRAVLRKKGELRRAIVLREILGPPVGMR